MSQGSSKIGVKWMAQIAMLAAVAVILMLLEVGLGFAPSFYKLDLSEVPVLLGAFAMGPIAAVLIEMVKILLDFMISGTMTAGVGELANFLIGCAFVVPAGMVYRKLRSRKGALIGCVLGTVTMVLIGCVLNAYILLPAYAAAFQMPIDGLVAMGSEVNGNITNLFTFIVFAVAPFNLIKGVVISAVVFLIYKKIRPIFKMSEN